MLFALQPVSVVALTRSLRSINLFCYFHFPGVQSTFPFILLNFLLIFSDF